MLHILLLHLPSAASPAATAAAASATAALQPAAVALAVADSVAGVDHAASCGASKSQPEEFGDLTPTMFLGSKKSF